MSEIKLLLYRILVDLDKEHLYDEVWLKIHSLQMPTTRKQIENDVEWALSQIEDT